MAIVVGLQNLPVSVNTITTTELVAAVLGRRIRVIGGFLTIAAAQTVKFQSATTDLTGAMGFGVNDQLDLEEQELITVKGEALNMVTSTTGLVSGWISYEIVGA